MGFPDIFFPRRHRHQRAGLAGQAVTICIPVYEGADFVEETIESALGQTYEKVHIAISVDRSTDRSPDLCRRFAAAPGVTVVEQDSRLGWIGNCNWLLSHVQTPYFCILPHDDLLDPAYVEKAIKRLKQHPDAIGVYPQIQGFGDRRPFLSDPDITGTPMERVLEILGKRLDAHAFRAVCRTPAGGIPMLEDNACNGYASDTVWFLDLAVRGTLLQVDEVLYHKRYHGRSQHGTWPGAADPRARAYWQEHCLQLTAHALGAATSDAEEREIIEAGAARNVNLMMRGGTGRPEPLDVEEFGACVRRRVGRRYG